MFSWGGDSLLVIDRQEFSTTDFKNWWSNWREKNQPLPETIDPYIDWILMAKEAERMMLFDDPSYHRDINIYLRVLSQVQLKNDEIDSKINITEKELRESYQELYTPVWLYNLVIVKDKDTADSVHADLVAGKISADDLALSVQDDKQVPQGHPSPVKEEKAAPEEIVLTSAGTDEQLLGVQLRVKRRPIKGDKVMEEVLRTLDPGTYSKPFAWQEAYGIVQLLERSDGDDEDYARMKASIATKIRKVEQGRLTIELIEKLKKKFNVTVNEERLKAIDPDAPDMQHVN